MALLIGIGMAWPFLSNTGLPAKTDAELHVYRTAELGYSVRAGSLYPRWAPDFYHGHGYPIFNYYAPLSYHLGYWLTYGNPARAASGARLAFILALVSGATGAYALGVVYGGPGGGLLAALAYATSPYILVINPHLRGNLPELLALGLLPWALWAWERVWRRGMGGRDLARSGVAAVIATSATFLSHNLVGLTTVALVAGLSLWRCLVVGDGRRLPRAALVAVTFVLLTAFFWLPFLAERRLVQLNVAGEGHYDFRNHFVAIRELVAPVLPIDRRATVPDVPMSTGLAPLVAAAVGVALALVNRRDLRGGVWFYVLSTALLLWLVTPASRVLWEAVPGLSYFQFPWRFLGPVAVLIVPPVASVVPETERLTRGGRGARLLGGALVGVLALALLTSALPSLSAPRWEPGFGFISEADLVAAELEGRWRGTTSTNDFVPVSVDVIPGPQESVVASYGTPPIDRVNRYTLPAGTSVRVVPDRPWVNRFAVAGEDGFLLRLYLFDFPGWRASIDGREVDIEVARPEGFITVPVPAGDHEVIVRFGSTPVRDLAWGFSAMGLGLLVVCGVCRVVVWLRGGDTHAAAGDHPSVDSATAPDAMVLQRSSVATIALLVGVFGLTTLCFLVPIDWPSYTSPPETPRPADFVQNASYREGLSLLGFDLSGTRVLPGDVLEVTLYWMAETEVTDTYQSFVHLVYPEGEIHAQSDHLNPGGLPTNQWPTDRYVRDRHRISVPEAASQGLYLLSVGLYKLEAEERLPVMAAQCGQRSDSVILCQSISIER